MKLIIESMGETLAEVIGAAIVIAAVGGCVALLRSFGDTLISYFL